MKTIEKINIIKGMLENVPHAFDDLYWDMANTTFKDEMFLAFIVTTKTQKEEALKIQSKVLPGNRLVRNILKEEVTECMGSYGKGFLGTSFYGTHTKKYISPYGKKDTM